MSKFEEKFQMYQRMDKKVDKLMEQIKHNIPGTCVATLGCDEDEDDWRNNKGFHIYITESDKGTPIWNLQHTLDTLRKVCYLNGIDHFYVEHQDFNKFSLRCYFKDDTVSLSAEILHITNEMFVSDDEKIKRIKEIITNAEGDE